MFTKAQTIQALIDCYRVGNASDSDSPAEWTSSAMSGEFCRSLDQAFRALQKAGVLTSEEVQEIYDTL